MSTVQLTREMRQEADRHTWLDFAGVMMILVGFFNVIDGISGISNAKYLSHHVLFSDIKAWGWFFLIVGVVQIIAGWAVMQGAGWAAVVGIATAFANALAHVSSSNTFVFWSITILVIDVLIIYGLVRYGGDRGRRAA
jgi:uncharacterized membrane protein